MAQLYYHRAYHADLLAEGNALADLIPYTQGEGSYHFQSYRMYMALIEAFAPNWYSDPVERVGFLNAEYERRAEIAELRLRGYDRRADRLERQTAKP